MYSLNEAEVLSGISLQHHYRGAEGFECYRGADWWGRRGELYSVWVHECFSHLQQLWDSQAGWEADEDWGECKLDASPILQLLYGFPLNTTRTWWVFCNRNWKYEWSSPCRCTWPLVLCMVLRGRLGTWSSVLAVLAVVRQTQSWPFWKTRWPQQPLRSNILSYRYRRRVFYKNTQLVSHNFLLYLMIKTEQRRQYCCVNIVVLHRVYQIKPFSSLRYQTLRPGYQLWKQLGWTWLLAIASPSTSQRLRYVTAQQISHTVVVIWWAWMSLRSQQRHEWYQIYLYVWDQIYLSDWGCLYFIKSYVCQYRQLNKEKIQGSDMIRYILMLLKCAIQILWLQPQTLDSSRHQRRKLPAPPLKGTKHYLFILLLTSGKEL